MVIVTYLRSLLTSLSLRERGGGRLLAGFGRLSLRKKDISKCLDIDWWSSLNSKELAGGVSAHLRRLKPKSSPEVFFKTPGGNASRMNREQMRN